MTKIGFWTIVFAIVIGLLIHDWIANLNIQWTAMTWFVVLTSVFIGLGLLLVIVLKIGELSEY